MQTSLDALRSLSSQMHLEPAEEVGQGGRSGCPKIDESRDSSGQERAGMVFRAAMPNGKQIKLLKTLLTSACERNCYYCPFRAGRNFHRATLSPDQMAETFMGLYRAQVVEGLFLSSGIIGGGIKTQDRLIATAEILRKQHAFEGYLHLKIMPGAERGQVERSMQLADRVSINLEAPNTERLTRLAPLKEFADELLEPLRWVEEIRSQQSPWQAWKGRWPSSVTQFVVGGAGENDLELLSTTERLYRQLGLRRAYYSPFSPVPDTPLENLPAESPVREQRLYQASFLLRDYGFSMEELPFDMNGFLPAEYDPKQAWARQNLAGRPVELNRASREELLRIPGIGPRAAQVILSSRRRNPLREVSDLRRLGISPARSLPFILLDGRQPAHQLALF